jgi:hypothetical protein
MQIWPFLLGTQWEARVKNNKVGCGYTSLDSSGQMAIEVVFWLLGLLVWVRMLL